MCEITDFTDSKSSSQPGSEAGVMPKADKTMPEALGLDLPSENMQSRHVGDNVAGPSRRTFRSSFIGMGFSPSLVDKVIEEKGEDDVDLLLETLFAYSDFQKQQSDSLDSFSGFLGENRDEEVADSHSKEEMNVRNPLNDEKIASLLMMDFSLDEVNFAMDKIGDNAPINELVDFIFAARIAENEAEEKHDRNQGNIERNEEANTEFLDGSMDKKLYLLELGFSESQISAAIKEYGSDVPVSKLVDSICADEVPQLCSEGNKNPLTPFSRNGPKNIIDGDSWFSGKEGDPSKHSFDPLAVQTEKSCPSASSQFGNIDLEKYRGKRPKEGPITDMRSLKRQKQELGYESSIFHSPSCPEARKQNFKLTTQRELLRKVGRVVEMPQIFKPKSCKSIDQMVAKPPYFFYGNAMGLSDECWMKISRFLYAVEPEFVNTQSFSALNRREGYVHNLPHGNRFYIEPRSPMTIQEAIPQTREWWPAWDTRKQLNCISSETNDGMLLLCDRFENMLNDSKGILSLEDQTDLMHQCRKLNLVWVAHHKLAPMEPEHIERILGYPMHHTRLPELSPRERLQTLKYCFQTDALGYHISALKSLFPGGITVLSVCTGCGGAEIALHRLGIHLKGVVSVEPGETKRKVLKNWWENSGQTGELVQFDNIQKLSSNKLGTLINKFGSFDFIVGQNPSVYHPEGAQMVLHSANLHGLDFSLFCEFVRVVQRVRSIMERRT